MLTESTSETEECQSLGQWRKKVAVTWRQGHGEEQAWTKAFSFLTSAMEGVEKYTVY